MNPNFLERWSREYPGMKDHLFVFLDGLSARSGQAIDEISKQLDEMVFREINCLDCAQCCKTTPALLTNRDIKRIAAFQKIPPKIFRRKYVLQDINGELSFSRVPCVFLNEDNTCAVYEVRPESCRDYPHTGSGSFRKRIPLHKKNMALCPAVFEIVKRMRSTGE